jgi:hypothetical protein
VLSQDVEATEGPALARLDGDDGADTVRVLLEELAVTMAH